jgi:hypothetical protein
MVRHLETHGLRCVYAGDIATGQDALLLTVADCNGADEIITNTPWFRRTLHALIRHFLPIARMWLLIDQDWATTKQATPFLKSCTDIIPIGRVQWIPGSKYKGGKDNAAWYHFDARHTAGPVFHAWRSAPGPSRATLCAQCSVSYRPESLGLQVLLERLPPARLSRARKRNASVTPPCDAADRSAIPTASANSAVCGIDGDISGKPSGWRSHRSHIPKRS